MDLKPGESKQLTVTLQPLLPTALGSRSCTACAAIRAAMSKGKGIDSSEITQLIIFINKPEQDHTFQLGTIRAAGRRPSADWLKMSPDEFFPMIDPSGPVHARPIGRAKMHSCRRT